MYIGIDQKFTLSLIELLSGVSASCSSCGFNLKSLLITLNSASKVEFAKLSFFAKGTLAIAFFDKYRLSNSVLVNLASAKTSFSEVASGLPQISRVTAY
ncbi:MAG: hypothetical protein GX326_07985 [Clostridiaceae bacterium]|nr:hypothetical protein [Clostridiaceae bacterium]